MTDTPAEHSTFPPGPGSADLEISESLWPGAGSGEDLPSPGSVLDLGELGAFRLETCLGRGGMGEVYRARQIGARGFSQAVAIKRLRTGRRDWEERSFADEARVLSLLHHENIARVYGFFELEGNSYLVMEYIRGQTLHALLEQARRKSQRLSERAACEIAAAVADALDCAHGIRDEAGRPLHVVHRDVSPTNILVSEAGRTKLVDFGVAYSRLDGRTKTSSTSTIIKGKAPYLSPEQVKHLPVDGRSDLFSLGTILVEMLTGEAPFGWTAEPITLRRIVQVTPEYVALATRGVNRKLRAVCQKLLAAAPCQRFATGREVALELRRCAGADDGPACVRADVERLRELSEAQGLPLRVVSGALHELWRTWLAPAGAGGIVLLGLVLALVLASPFLTRATPRDPPMSIPEALPTAAQAGSLCSIHLNSWKAFSLASFALVAACQPHAAADARSNQCAKTPINQVRNKKGVWVDLPRQFWVQLVSLDGERCTGEPIDWGRVGPNLDQVGPLDEGKREPCPYGDGRLVATMSWQDPRTDAYKPGPGPRYRERPLLFGRSRVVPVKGTGVEILEEPAHLDHPRAAVARMTALFTEMQLVDGVKVSICGVLFWHDGKEGVPVLTSEYYGHRTGADWGEDSFVQLFDP